MLQSIVFPRTGAPMPPLDLTDAEKLKEIVVDPLVSALRSEMRESMHPLIEDVSRLRQSQRGQQERIDQIDIRLGAIERFKLKIAAVCSGIAVVTGIIWRTLLDWAKAHLPKPH
jgi:hypothetical protein